MEAVDSLSTMKKVEDGAVDEGRGSKYWRLDTGSKLYFYRDHECGIRSGY